jgi:hypothetical protein
LSCKHTYNNNNTISLDANTLAAHFGDNGDISRLSHSTARLHSWARSGRSIISSSSQQSSSAHILAQSMKDNSSHYGTMRK